MTGAPEGSPKVVLCVFFNGFMEKPRIEPATPGLQGIALIHYTTGASQGCFCLFDLILYVPSTIFQLYRDESSWVEPVLS